MGGNPVGGFNFYNWYNNKKKKINRYQSKLILIFINEITIRLKIIIYIRLRKEDIDKFNDEINEWL